MGDSDPRALFTYVAEQLGRRHVAFLFVRETEGDDSLLSEIRARFDGPVVANDEMGADDGRRLIGQGVADTIAFGRDFIATPDLVDRIADGTEWNVPDPGTFYGSRDRDPALGYTDYPTTRRR